jgi:hypothetical protein
MLILSDNSIKYGSVIYASSESVYFPATNLKTLLASDVWRSAVPGAGAYETFQINLNRSFHDETLYLAFNRGFDFTGLSSVEYAIGLLAGGEDSFVPIIGYTEGKAFLVKIEVGSTPRDYIVLKFTKNDSSTDLVQLGKVYAGAGFDTTHAADPDKGGYSHVFYEVPNTDYALGGQKFSEGVYQSWRGSMNIPYLQESLMTDLRAFIQRTGTFFPFWIMLDNDEDPEGVTEQFTQIRYVTLSSPPTEVWKEFGAAGYFWALSLAMEEQL